LDVGRALIIDLLEQNGGGCGTVAGALMLPPEHMAKEHRARIGVAIG